MAKTTFVGLKREIANILAEAKKVKKKSSTRLPPQIEAFGHYDKEHDFSEPLGARNLYRQQGSVNWGPNTGPGDHFDTSSAGPNSRSAASQMKESDESAIRSLVREVITNGLIDESSAWAPFLASKAPIFESTWEEVEHRMNEAWYDDFKKDKKSDDDDKPKKKGTEKTSYGPVKKHGEDKKK